ncbi:hypothetical protein PACILC2_13590 [Paenibacillus cisolokensis]|uniref:PNPLA domain-containing protein n=1 Tax=Paenibacillus cisolokensis TaxID=1658519 RepID=A0ABQ4N4B5_9BACL|nr:hypothetical protein PACILC2_13590 [Paenibacillus cisolokensis]
MRMKVGLALGGGAIRGLAHIGVLKVLKKHRIPIDFIAGTSMGGAIGGLVAAGIDIEEIEEFVLRTPSYRLVDIGIRKRGIFAGNKIYAMLIRFLGNKGLGDIVIENLAIPFRAVSVDLMKGDVFVLTRAVSSWPFGPPHRFPVFSPPFAIGAKCWWTGACSTISRPICCARKWMSSSQSMSKESMKSRSRAIFSKWSTVLLRL